jgi:hypothetical protein
MKRELWEMWRAVDATCLKVLNKTKEEKMYQDKSGMKNQS